MTRFGIVTAICAASLVALACGIAQADVDTPTLPPGAEPLLYLYSALPGQDVPETGWNLGGPYGPSLGDALDGNWDHTQGSSAWDGSAPGGVWGATINGINDPGGAVHEVEGADDVLSIVDPGDPRTAGFNDPSNRKVYFAEGSVPGLKLRPAGDPGIYMVSRLRMDPAPLETNLDTSISDSYGMSAGDAGMVNLGRNTKGLTMGYDGPTSFFIEGLSVALPSGTSFDFHEIAATMGATATAGVFDVKVWIDGIVVLSNPALTVTGDSEVGGGGIGFGFPATSSKGAMQLDYIGIGNLTVPEPASGILMSFALGLVALLGRRRGR
jgi:hypothetical protein